MERSHCGPSVRIALSPLGGEGPDEERKVNSTIKLLSFYYCEIYTKCYFYVLWSYWDQLGHSGLDQIIISSHLLM